MHMRWDMPERPHTLPLAHIITQTPKGSTITQTYPPAAPNPSRRPPAAKAGEHGEWRDAAEHA